MPGTTCIGCTDGRGYMQAMQSVATSMDASTAMMLAHVERLSTQLLAYLNRSQVARASTVMIDGRPVPLLEAHLILTGAISDARRGDFRKLQWSDFQHAVAAIERALRAAEAEEQRNAMSAEIKWAILGLIGIASVGVAAWAIKQSKS